MPTNNSEGVVASHDSRGDLFRWLRQRVAGEASMKLLELQAIRPILSPETPNHRKTLLIAQSSLPCITVLRCGEFR